MKKEYFCIDCGVKVSNYSAKRCKACYGLYLSKKLLDEQIRAKRSVMFKEVLEGKKYKLSPTQLKKMAEGRKLVPKGFNGYFRVKFKADQDILDKAEEFIKTQPFIFDSREVYNYLIDTKNEYVQNRLTHNSIQAILMKLGYESVKIKKKTCTLWYKKGAAKGKYALLKNIQNHLIKELDISSLQARHLINLIKGGSF